MNDCKTKATKSTSLSLAYISNSRSSHNNLLSSKPKPNNSKTLFISPIIERHPSATNLLKENTTINEQKKADCFLCVNIIVSPPLNEPNIKPGSYYIQIDTIEDKLYENNETFWVKNSINQQKNEVINKITSENCKRNVMSISEIYLDNKITDAIRKKNKYEVIENAFEKYLRHDKK